MFRENKISKLSEVFIYILLIKILYSHMSQTSIQLVGAPILYLGAILFLIAKISVVKRGMYFTFGCDNMSKKMMWLYFAGYLLMITGYLVTFSIVEVG